MDKLTHILIAVSISFVTYASHAWAYVFVDGSHPKSNKPAQLPASLEAPNIEFHISGNAPSISNKSKFKSGQYQDLGDLEFFRAVVSEAMNVWNAVDDSYLRLTLSSDEGPGKNSSDHIYNISFNSDLSWSVTGQAEPTTNILDVYNNTSLELVIDDCDIELGTEKVSAPVLAHTILHELGHCIGLGHTHSSTKSIMGYGSSSEKFSLDNDDKAGIIVLYPVHPSQRKSIVPTCGSAASANSKIALSVALLVLLFPIGIAAIALSKSSA